MNQSFPDSQKEPFGPNQLAWLHEKYGKAFFRDGFTPCERCPKDHEPARAP
jgi:hypothetical protein